MTKSELNDPYFEWMYRLVVDDRYSNKSYRRLFYKLHDTGDKHIMSITNGIDLHFLADDIFIDQHRLIFINFNGGFQASPPLRRFCLLI